MVGTSTGTAPYARRRSLISPAWSLVRGTSTRQPNSGRLSHQESLARLSTAAPMVATTAPESASRPAVFSATAASLLTTLFWPVPEPPAVTTTGVAPVRPPSTRRIAASGSSSTAGAESTSGLPVAAAAAASGPRSAPARRSAVSAVPPRATPANAGTAVPVATPGTTSNGTEVRPTASSSLTAASEVNGSPATRRTTTAPPFAAATAAWATSAGRRRRGSARRRARSRGRRPGRRPRRRGRRGRRRPWRAPRSPGRSASRGRPGLRRRRRPCRPAHRRSCGSSGAPASWACDQAVFGVLGRHQFGGTAVEQLGGERAAQGRRFAERAGDRAADGVAAVQGGHRSAEEQLGAVLAVRHVRVGGDRRAAAGFQRGEGAPLGDHAGTGAGVLERGEQCAGALVVLTALDGERPLGGGGQHLQRVERLGDRVQPAEAGQPRPGEDDGVEVARAHPRHAGVDVAPDRDDVEPEAQRPDLGHPPRGAGADR